MKKWLVALLVLLALLVLISPGIVGMLAEREMEEAVSQAERGSPGISVTTERFEREWFTSEGRHRIELTGGEMYATASEVAREAGQDSVPALVINTELQHGIRQGSGGILPVLARSVSTLQLETGDGEVFDVPGTLNTEVSLTGITSSRYLLDAGSFASDGAEGVWEGADMLFTISPSGSAGSVSGTIDPWSIQAEVSGLRAGSTSIDATVRDSEFGFRTGSVDLEIDGLSVSDANGIVELQKLSLQSRSELDGRRVEARADVSVGQLMIPGTGEVNVVASASASGIDAASLRQLLAALESAESSMNPNPALAAMDGLVGADLQGLLNRGADIRIDRLDLELPQGAMHATLDFDLPQSDSGELKPWASLALQLTASANIEIDDSLLQFAQSIIPEIGSLIGLGFLRRDGNVYRLAAEVKNGQLTINGAPMALPMSFD